MGKQINHPAAMMRIQAICDAQQGREPSHPHALLFAQLTVTDDFFALAGRFAMAPRDERHHLAPLRVEPRQPGPPDHVFRMLLMATRVNDFADIV